MVQEVRDSRTQRNCVDKFFVEVLHDAFTEITGTISQFPAVDRKELYDAAQGLLNVALRHDTYGVFEK